MPQGQLPGGPCAFLVWSAGQTFQLSRRNRFPFFLSESGGGLVTLWLEEGQGRQAVTIHAMQKGGLIFFKLQSQLREDEGM